MQFSTEFQEAMNLAQQHKVAGRLLEAERVLRHLVDAGEHTPLALEALADIYFQQRRLGECLQILKELKKHDRENVHYCTKLASLYEAVGDTNSAIGEYERLLRRKPDEANAHFNVALLYAKLNRYDDALAAYEAAARLGIDRVEEVYSNVGNLYSEMLDASNARKYYELALSVAPENATAMFNLAGHLEESGEKDEAVEMYEKILALDPTNWKSLARLAYPRRLTPDDGGLIDRLKRGIESFEADPQASEVLHFALGKAYDDLGMYAEAAEQFIAANEKSRSRVRTYDAAATERAFGEVIELFDSSWPADRTTSSGERPVFICGMYRSGSTLIESMLSGHPAMAAGGELNALPLLTAQHLGPFPKVAARATREQLSKLADDYAALTRKLAPDAISVTDKRPDNFLRAGLIRAAFPKAKVIHTRRDKRDNCLSIYFQQFGRATHYANDMQNIAHYYEQQERLFAHWRACFPDQVHVVEYEKLIESPEVVLRGVLDFLGFDWAPEVLDFQQSRKLVRTYSIWQVREGLYKRSINRWRNYETLFVK